MSFLPSINIGQDKSRSKFQLGADTNTTAEIGWFQPTYCREIVPDSDVTISSRNAVRLSPLAVPTFGRLSLRNYYYFVDYTTLYLPFDAFRKGVNYAYSDGTVASPTFVPTFTGIEFFKFINTRKSAKTPMSDLACDMCFSLYKDGAEYSGNISNFTADIDISDGRLPFLPFLMRSKNILSAKNTSETTYVSVGNDGNYYNLITRPYITNKQADCAITVHGTTATWTLLGKFYGRMKRLRKHFIGSGYAWNIYDTTPQHPLKLMAIYKAWYDTFAVQRTMNFNNTNLYALIKKLSENHTQSSNIFDTGSGYYDAGELFTKFLEDLADISYVLPADYFSAGDSTTVRGWDNPDGLPITSPNKIYAGLETNYDSVGVSNGEVITGVNTVNNNMSGVTSVTAMNMAQKLLKYVNKRSAVGKKITSLLKLDNEIDLHNTEHETVHHLGSDKTNIEISDVTSLADTTSASLGDYAGKGVGFGSTDHFKYDTKTYGVLLCLSAIVPVSGYYQGILRENQAVKRYDFFQPQFDAVGYQSVRTNELLADTQFCGAFTGSSVELGTDLGLFSIAPRYQHYKVSRAIVNGDMSLGSMEDVMLPYNLDRHFITRVPVDSSLASFENYILPTNNPDTFRKITSESPYGDYNRIFQYTPGDYDHFIIQMVFDVDVVSPMKSIADSYDTFDSADDTSFEVNHQ